MNEYGYNDWREYLVHGAEWKNHRYIMRIGRGSGARYFYTAKDIADFRSRASRNAGKILNTPSKKMTKVSSKKKKKKGSVVSGPVSNQPPKSTSEGGWAYSIENGVMTRRKISAADTPNTVGNGRIIKDKSRARKRKASKNKSNTTLHKSLERITKNVRKQRLQRLLGTRR